MVWYDHALRNVGWPGAKDPLRRQSLVCESPGVRREEGPTVIPHQRGFTVKLDPPPLVAILAPNGPHCDGTLGTGSPL